MNPHEAHFYALTMKLFGQLRPRGGAGKVLLVSSARAGEGKTFIASALARTMAALDEEPVALVDANLRAPGLGAHFGLPAGSGFAECLASGSLDVPLRALPGSRLSVLPMGVLALPGTLFKTQRVAAVFDALRARFGFTVVDADVLGDCGALPHLADGTAMVVDSSRTRREVVQGVLGQVRLAPDKLLGGILNRRQQYIPAMLYRAL